MAVLLSLSASLGSVEANPSAIAGMSGKPEYWIKAQFLYHFCKETEWPEARFPKEDSPVIIGIHGSDPFDEHLSDVAKEKTVNGRKIELRTLKTLDKAAEVHLLFIVESDDDKMKSLIAAVKGKSILTCSDHESFVDFGGIVGFKSIEERRTRIGYELNLKIALRDDLKIGRKLVTKAARVVEPKRDKEGDE